MRRFFPVLLLTAAVLLTYAPAVRNGFVWDDSALLLRDPLIRSWRLIPEGFQHFLFLDATASDFYRPIQRLSYTLEYVAVGLQPAVHHAMSILWHLAAALALFFFSRELLRVLAVEERTRRWAPTVAALVWAVHPVHSSAVIYISGRADPLAGTFGFLALYLGLRSLGATGARVWGLTFGAAVAFLLSGLSKEAGLVFLALWLVILLLQKNWKATVRAAVVALFVIVGYLSLRLPAEHNPAPRIRPPPPPLVKPILAARAVAEYAGLLIFPVNLRMERDVETYPAVDPKSGTDAGAAWRELQTLAGILLIGGFSYALVRSRRRNRPVFTCLVLTAVAYLPVSGLFSLNASVAEHWLYLPAAFLFLALSIAAAGLQLAASSRLLRVGAAGALVLWMLFLSGRAFARTFDWKDQRTFLERTIAAGGDSPRMLINLAGLEMNSGRLEEAKKLLDSALGKEPDQPIAVLNRAALAVKMNDLGLARDLLKRATDMPLVEAQAHELLAVVTHKESGTLDVQRMRLASRTGIPNWAIEKRYVKVLHEAGATDRAIAELRHCLTTQWYRADTWHLLAELLAATGKRDAALEALQQAHRYDVHLAPGTPAL